MTLATWGESHVFRQRKLLSPTSGRITASRTRKGSSIANPVLDSSSRAQKKKKKEKKRKEKKRKTRDILMLNVHAHSRGLFRVVER
jgi:FtsZ-interacting cell division protein ZipA